MPGSVVSGTPYIVCDSLFLLNIAVRKFVNIRLQHEQFITSLNNSKPEESYFQQKKKSSQEERMFFFINGNTLLLQSYVCI